MLTTLTKDYKIIEHFEPILPHTEKSPSLVEGARLEIV